MKLIEQLINVSNLERMKILEKNLKENKINYIVQYIENEVGNIIVDYSNNDKYVLLVAHYDSIKNSSGANDNASGVSVLFRLVLCEEIKDLNCKIVFTALEEDDGKGMKEYIKKYGASNIYKAINIDSCGWGNRVVLCRRTKNDISKNIVGAEFLRFIPYGDDAILEDYGVDVISVSVVDELAYKCFKEIGQFIYNKTNISKELKKEYNNLKLFETMHCGKYDNIQCIDEINLIKTFETIKRMLR